MSSGEKTTNLFLSVLTSAGTIRTEDYLPVGNREAAQKELRKQYEVAWACLDMLANEVDGTYAETKRNHERFPHMKRVWVSLLTILCAVAAGVLGGMAFKSFSDSSNPAAEHILGKIMSVVVIAFSLWVLVRGICGYAVGISVLPIGKATKRLSQLKDTIVLQKRFIGILRDELVFGIRTGNVCEEIMGVDVFSSAELDKWSEPSKWSRLLKNDFHGQASVCLFLVVAAAGCCVLSYLLRGGALFG